VSANRLLAAVLITSGLLNVYLMVRKRPQRAREQHPAPIAQHERPTARARVSWPEDGAEGHEPAHLGRQQREQRLLEIEEEVERLRPADQRFGHAAPTPEKEQVVRLYLDDLFDVAAGNKRNYTLECRGTVCKWSSELSDAMHRIQAFQVKGLVKGLLFGRRENFIDLNEDSDSRASTLMTNLTVAFHRSPAFQTCTASLVPEDVLITWTLTFEPADRHLTAAATMWTAAAGNEPSLVCQRALQSVADATPIPADIVSIPEWEFSFLLPPSDQR
jgi:hypothetical protein